MTNVVPFPKPFKKPPPEPSEDDPRAPTERDFADDYLPNFAFICRRTFGNGTIDMYEHTKGEQAGVMTDDNGKMKIVEVAF